MKHHYIPQFYLRAWHAHGESKVVSYTRDPKGLLRRDFRPSKSICFDRGLYAMQPDGLLAPEEANDDIETMFFQKMDDAAAVAHQNMLARGVAGLSLPDRLAWSRFTASLLERTPKNIEAMTAASMPEIERTLRDIVDTSPSPAFKRIATKLLAKADTRKAARNAMLWAMKKVLEEGTTARQLNALEWLTVDHQNPKEHFLTSDNPILLNDSKRTSPILLVSFALSPYRLLIMRKPCPEFDEDSMLRTAAMHSLRMCEQADHYLISSRLLEKGAFTHYLSAAESLFRIDGPDRGAPADR